MQVHGQPIAGGIQSALNFGGRVGAFAVDDESIYTVDYGTVSTSTVRRQPVNGGTETTVGTVPSRGGETIILVNGDLFVGTQFSADLYRIPQGTQPVEVFANLGVNGVEQLAYDERFIYASSARLSGIVRVNRTSRQVSPVLMESRQVFGIAVTPTLLFYAVHLSAEIWAIRKPRD